MRQRFEQQLDLRITAISDIQIPTKSRDELPAVLRALQHIFITPSLNEKVFHLLEEQICKDKKKTGRKGMDLWHVLVLAVLRHALDTNWDRLHLMANGDRYVRNILGVLALGEDDEFQYQTILDNVSLIDESLLLSINDIVVEAGHSLVKKKEEEVLKLQRLSKLKRETKLKEVLGLQLKSDSYALETNVHFPTDLNLLWDSTRKCLDMIGHLRSLIELSGWRKIKDIRKELKSQFRKTSQAVFKGKKEDLKKQHVKEYLRQAQLLAAKCKEVLQSETQTMLVAGKEEQVAVLLQELEKYTVHTIKFIDLIDRRLLKGEAIPSSEKIYSIFEEHTEWISKGKLNKKVELGHLILITTDQYQYIVDYKIMEGEKDPSQVASLTQRLQEKFANNKIHSLSFDKGFYSQANAKTLEDSKVKEAILPKRGKHSKDDTLRESSKTFKKLRNQHSAVESNINMLEHHGLNRCMDKGIHGFKRCVGLSVLAYNLHILGNQIRAIQKEKAEAEEKKQRILLRKAA
jgi:IS5 family transposase